ncbi:MAG: ComEC/Rec2 family competence protein, partial [Bdellovibrionota bacterium]
RAELLSLTLSGTAATALAFGPRVKKRVSSKWTRSIATRFRDAIVLQLRIYLVLLPALSPLVLQHPLSIAWNLIAGPIVGHVLFPLSLVAFFVPALTAIGDETWRLTLALVHQMSTWTPRLTQTASTTPLHAVAYLLAILFLVIGRERRVRARAALVSIILFTSFAVRAEELVVWNVGQGSWATMTTPESCLHFDLGGEFAPWDKIRSACEGRRNEAIFSHWDWDHVSFASSAAKRFGLCVLAEPGGKKPEKRSNLLLELPRCTESLAGLVEHTPLPTKRSLGSNASSRVFSFAGALFTGDVPKRQESKLRKLARTRVLIVSHHGSKTSSSEEFLIRVAPKLAVVSARTAKYGHPHAVVVDRLRRLGIPLLRTEDWGSIHVQMKRPKLFELRPLERIKVCRPDTPC